jgi:hypothetical protein
LFAARTKISSARVRNSLAGTLPHSNDGVDLGHQLSRFDDAFSGRRDRFPDLTLRVRGRFARIDNARDGVLKEGILRHLPLPFACVQAGAQSISQPSREARISTERN